MKAAVLHEAGQPIQIEDVRVDLPGAREVLVRTGATGVCHSDLHFLDGAISHPMPVVLGHEASGTVEAVGNLVTYVKPGDRVVTCLSVFCGLCENCTSGNPARCSSRSEFQRSPGEPPRLNQNGKPVHQLVNISSFAEQMLVPENAVVKVREDVPFEQLALVGCAVTTGVGAVFRTAGVEPGSTVAVIGCGGVGLNCVQGAALAGASRIIAIDVVETKLALARQFGATDIVDASSGDVVQRVKDMTGGGPHYSFEAIGKKETAEQAFNMLRPGGTATVIGLFPPEVTIELQAGSLTPERRIQGSNMGSNRFRTDMPRYIEFYLQGRLKLDELVSRRIRLEQINQAFEDMKSGQVARSVITFEQG